MINPKNRKRCGLLSLLAAVFVAPSTFAAVTLTFDGANAQLSGTTAEGPFSYNEFSGGLERQSNYIGASFLDGPGVLKIFRNDVAGGLFTFDSIQTAKFGGVGNIQVQGFLGGVLQATDSLAALGGLVFSTQPSVNLNGVNIDELRITLDTDLDTFGQAVDNARLTAQGGGGPTNPPAGVPEPTFALSFVALGLAGMCRRKRA